MVGMTAAFWQRQSINAGHVDYLAQGWARLHLAVETPERVPSWDVILLTAASPLQAALYERQLQAVRRRGRVPAPTRVLVVPDPLPVAAGIGAERPRSGRIGSGGATLHALRVLAQEDERFRLSRRAGAVRTAARVLLIHAGGDSRRLPWVNLLGKPFLPLPLLADADHAVPTLFEHLLAIVAPLAAAMPQGGLLTLAGDVLPLFAAGNVRLPDDGGLVVTTPAPLDLAQRHGVVVPARPTGRTSTRVVRLLQKASAEELVAADALVAGGAALLDTGIYAFTGSAFARLLQLATSEPNPVDELRACGEEISLYEEIASALVRQQHPWLKSRPLGARLIGALGGEPLHQHCVVDMAFLHFGTTAEVLRHLSRFWHGHLTRRVLAECGPAVSDSAIVCDSWLDTAAQVGSESLVYLCRLGPDVRIGNRCVVVGADTGNWSLCLRDHTCLWQVPVSHRGGIAWVTACCGVDDNPKLSHADATFANQAFMQWVSDHGITAEDLWSSGEERILWTARLFPAYPARERTGLAVAEWLIGDVRTERDRGELRRTWRRAHRLSFADLHRMAHAAGFQERTGGLVEELALAAVRRTVAGGLERNIAALAGRLVSERARRSVSALLRMYKRQSLGHHAPIFLPESRQWQMHADLLTALGRRRAAQRAVASAFGAVRREVADALSSQEPGTVCGIPAGKWCKVELPARFDIAGGWSDTPPYCLERPAAVLNFALTLNGRLPIGASVEALAENRWELCLADTGMRTVISKPAEISAHADVKDPFNLLRMALLLVGYGSARGITQGVRVRTWSRVPRGSGLGASSILGAALVTALLRLAGRAHDPATVCDFVLVLEQRMTTGGGWQDQVGGLFPGLKYTSSVPVRPLRLTVEPVPLLPEVVRELEQRFVVAYTGQERLARNVLQIVVGRYLQRDARLLGAIARLVELAEEGRAALARGELDRVGAVLAETWHVHQQLDPHCSNPRVDALFAAVRDFSCGGKLAGAGGGGFIGILAKDQAAAARIRACLVRTASDVRLYDWRLWPVDER